MTLTRQTAKKCMIKDILEGRYVRREGWEPNYLETNYGKISRVNLMGLIIGADEYSLTLDDGSGQISLRSFEETTILKGKLVGDIVLVIGRPRLFNEQRFIVPEIIKKIVNPKWIKYRKLELTRAKITIKPNNEEQSISEVKTESNITDALIKKITELDKGNGTIIEELFKYFEESKANRTINQLIEQGEIFEIKPGIVKVI
ncbi:hypothetical protein H8D36_00900 [archaeon]|nr:hypothetical protein [archaeon]MBL7056686.1 hypothetical protein [Candidatus Woesearchaeota archaeon]